MDYRTKNFSNLASGNLILSFVTLQNFCVPETRVLVGFADGVNYSIHPKAGPFRLLDGRFRPVPAV
jgi:hypothetical protein